jgi:hypothetical protein
MDGKLKVGEARLEQIDGAPGVYRPEDAIRLEVPDVFHAAAIEHWVAAMRDESAIEIGAQKSKV